MTPLISIITPTYNAEKFIKEGVQSVVNQTLDKKNYEWIILDDGSQDNTLEELKRNVRSLENIFVFSRNKNLGTSKTREQAINLSKGKYLAFFDIDDLLRNNALKSTLNFMESNPAVKLSYSQYNKIDSNGNFICERLGHPFSREKLLHFNFIGHLKCIERKVHDEIRGFDPAFFRYAEDYDYVLRASEHVNPDQIKQNPEILYDYRIHENNNMKNIEVMRENSCLAIKNSLKREEDMDANVFWSRVTDDKYNYYDWKEKPS